MPKGGIQDHHKRLPTHADNANKMHKHHKILSYFLQKKPDKLNISDYSKLSITPSAKLSIHVKQTFNGAQSFMKTGKKM